MKSRIDQATASLLAAEAAGDIARSARIVAWLSSDRALLAGVLCNLADTHAEASVGQTYGDVAERAREIVDGFLGRWSTDGVAFADIAQVAKAAMSWAPVHGHRFTSHGHFVVAATVTPRPQMFPLASCAARIVTATIDVADDVHLDDVLDALGGDQGHATEDDAYFEDLARKSLDLDLLGLPDRPSDADDEDPGD